MVGASDDHTIRRLEHQVHTGREQTKDLIHELHLLEMKMQRELAAQEREYREDRDAWRDERAALQLRLEEYAHQVDSLKDEKAKWMSMLQEMGAGRIEAHELARNTAVQLQLLEAAHEREINGWKKQMEAMKEQLVRVRAQRDASERKMSKQGYDFAVVAEGAIRSDARMQVLQRHIHDLHLRDQKKDEHLHDVAQFVKKSLAPFVLEMNEQQIPVCRHCKKHHAAFDAKHSCGQELS
jgi:chromosome segregation ATPase